MKKRERKPKAKVETVGDVFLRITEKVREARRVVAKAEEQMTAAQVAYNDAYKLRDQADRELNEFIKANVSL